MPVVRTYRPDERPDVEFLVDGQSCKGELRQWSVDESDNWSAQVNWRRQIGTDLYRHHPCGPNPAR